MVEVQYQSIIQARTNISAQRQAIQQARVSQPQPTQAELRSGGLAGMQRLQAQRPYQEQLQQAEQQISAEQARIETEIARYNPEQAQPEYLDIAYKEALATIKPQIESYEKQIAEKIAHKEELAQGGISSDERRGYEITSNRIAEMQARLAPYKNLLGASKEEVIKKVFSGEVQQVSKYEGDVMSMSFNEGQSRVTQPKVGTVEYSPGVMQILMTRAGAGEQAAIDLLGSGKISGVATEIQRPAGENLIFNKGGSVIGVESLSLGKTFGSLEGYNKAIEKYNAGLIAIPPQNILTASINNKPIGQPQGFIQRFFQPITEGLAIANVKTSQFLESKGITGAKIQKYVFGDAFGLSEKNRIGEKVYYKKYPLQKSYEEYTLGLSTGIIKKPVTSAITAGAFVFAPSIISKAVKVTKLAPILSKELFAKSIFTTTPERTIVGGIAGLYGTSIVSRIKGAEGSYEKGIVTGKRLGTELIPATVGGLVASKFIPRVASWLQPTGQKLDLSKITPKEYYKKLQSGEIVIPQEPIAMHLKLFKEMKYAPPGSTKPVGYTFTGDEFLGIYQEKGIKYMKVLSTKELKAAGLDVKPREAIGTYIAPYPSLYFARLPIGKTEYYGGSFSTPFTTPKGLIVEPSKFKVAGITTKGGEKMIMVAPGEAGVPGTVIGKTEPQAIIPPPTTFQFTGERYSIWYKGYKIPLEKVTTTLRNGKVPVGKEVKFTIDSSYGMGKSYVTTPSSYLTLGAIPKSSYIKSSTYTTPPITSIAPSLSKLSKISYTPSIVSKSSVSKVPSSITSIVPSASYLPRLSEVPKPSISKIPYSATPSVSRVPYVPSKVPTYRVPPPPPSYPSKITKSVISKLLSTRTAYNVFTKRFGKEVQIGKALPLGKAKLLGTKVTKSTLARTIKLKEAGTTSMEDIQFNISPREFRTSKKREPLTYIQIKALTRGTQEIPEIQMARRTKSKSKKLKWL